MSDEPQFGVWQPIENLHPTHCMPLPPPPKSDDGQQ